MFRTRDLLVRQRTQMINALRGHLAEFGLVVAKDRSCRQLLAMSKIHPSTLPEPARLVLDVLIDELRALDERVAVLDAEISAAQRTIRPRDD